MSYNNGTTEYKISIIVLLEWKSNRLMLLLAYHTIHCVVLFQFWLVILCKRITPYILWTAKWFCAVCAYYWQMCNVKSEFASDSKNQMFTMAQFMWKMIPDPYPYNEFAHFWWQKCGCRWPMAQPHMPKSALVSYNFSR